MICKAAPIILILSFLFSCKRETGTLPSAILVTGHGGCGFETYRNNIPPNTLESVHRGFFIEGADAVEMDVQLTSDSELVLIHNEILDGFTNLKGCVSSYSGSELQKAKILSRNGPVDGVFHIPLLDDVFDLLDSTTAILFLNVKSHDPCIRDSVMSYRERFARVLSRKFEGRNLFGQCYIETLDLELLKSCQAKDARFRFIYDDEDFDRALKITTENDFDGFAISNEKITASQVASGKSAGKLVIIWGVKIYQASKKAVEKLPDVIMTDDIRMLRNIVGK